MKEPSGLKEGETQVDCEEPRVGEDSQVAKMKPRGFKGSQVGVKKSKYTEKN